MAKCMTTPSLPTLASNLIVTTGQAITNGFVPQDIYNQRLATCFSCEHYLHDTRRCALCGCFMVAKARIGGDPNSLCPQRLWQR